MYNIGWTFDCFGLRLSCRQFERNLLLHCNMAHTVNELWCKNESTEHDFCQKLRLTFMMTGQDLFWTIEISMMTSRNFYDGRSRFYSKRSSFSWWQVEILLRTVMMTDRDFILNGQGFHDDRLESCSERWRFSWWQIEIFLMTQVKTLLWTVEIFMMTSRDFHDGKLRFCSEWSVFSWWQVEIFMKIGRDFTMNGRGFHDDSSRFSWW